MHKHRERQPFLRSEVKNYKPGFDVGGLIVFLIIMIPNFVWFALPAPNDILRGDSITETVDAAGSVFQFLTIAALCVLIRKERLALKRGYIIAAGICVLIYYAGWALYYSGLTAPPVIAALTLPPCLALLLYAVGRRNFAAVIFGSIFTLCHLIYGTVNFII